MPGSLSPHAEAGDINPILIHIEFTLHVVEQALELLSVPARDRLDGCDVNIPELSVGITAVTGICPALVVHESGGYHVPLALVGVCASTPAPM